MPSVLGAAEVVPSKQGLFLFQVSRYDDMNLSTAGRLSGWTLRRLVAVAKAAGGAGIGGRPPSFEHPSPAHHPMSALDAAPTLLDKGCHRKAEMDMSISESHRDSRGGEQGVQQARHASRLVQAQLTGRAEVQWLGAAACVPAHLHLGPARCFPDVRLQRAHSPCPDQIPCVFSQIL